MSGHYTEAFIEDGAHPGQLVMGWQCFTCGTEATGFATFAAAEAAADEHEAAS